MNDKSILVKLFLLTLFIGNVSMNLVAEGSEVVGEGSEVVREIPAYGWLGPGDALMFLEEARPELRKFEEVPLIHFDDYQPKYTQTQNIARWALSHVTQPSLLGLIHVGYPQNELLTGMIWLIALAEGKEAEWMQRAAKWKQHKAPPGCTRMASFNPNAVDEYEWLTKARKSKLVGSSASDDTAIAAYLGWLLSAQRKVPWAIVYYPK